MKPEEDLILEGTERTITRVQAGTPYSCLMLKSQRFSSLFRHYAKHHGLRKVRRRDTAGSVLRARLLATARTRVGIGMGLGHL